MPCYSLKDKDGKYLGKLCAKGGGNPKPCRYCGQMSEFLCDFPIGKTPSGRRKTCDMAMCADCTQKGNNPKFDFCRKHYPMAKAAYERRLARAQAG